ncbi:hypothetical protein [Helicobacter sp. T3_23-1059]
MYKQKIQEVEKEINDLILDNADTSIINALRQELNRLIALQKQYETELDSLLQAKKEQQTKQEQEKERQEALKQVQLAKKQAELARLLAQCSTPPQAQI